MQRRVLLAVMLIAGAALAQDQGLPDKITGPPRDRAKFMAARQGKLQQGDPAPDFALKIRGGEQVVRLWSFQGKKPVALIFGSYT